MKNYMLEFLQMIQEIHREAEREAKERFAKEKAERRIKAEEQENQLLRIAHLEHQLTEQRAQIAALSNKIIMSNMASAFNSLPASRVHSPGFSGDGDEKNAEISSNLGIGSFTSNLLTFDVSTEPSAAPSVNTSVNTTPSSSISTDSQMSIINLSGELPASPTNE